MLYYKEVEAKDKKLVKNYFMTQGDTFSSQLKLFKGESEVPTDLIREIRFKLSDIDYNLEYSKLYEYNADLGKWLLNIDSEDTANWAVDTHIYEYQVTYIDGTVRTPVQAKFTVLNQIKGE